MRNDPHRRLNKDAYLTTDASQAVLRTTIQRHCRTIALSLIFAISVSACDRAGDQKNGDRTPAKVDKLPSNVKSDHVEPAPIDPVFVNATSLQRVTVQTDPQPIYRPDDLRPRYDDEKISNAGIRIFESKRLKLYTDIDSDLAKSLPGLIDQLYVAWEAYLGPMPPDRAGTDFQISGYLMRDMAVFRDLGLMPEEIVIDHGRHRRNEFWMRDQGFDYYRRHLLIHEATHCYMTYMPDVNAPVWYLEGMAEYFGTHRLNDENKATFRVMPSTPTEFAGFGRIMTIREDVAANKARTIDSIVAFRPIDFLTTHHYGWSWALCAFLDGTPRYQEKFQNLSRFTQGTQFAKMFHESFDSAQRDLATEWTLFSYHLQYDYDIARAAIDFKPGTSLTENRTVESVEVDASRGWQSSHVRLEQGRTYTIMAKGQFSLGDLPKPWLSEPQGISFRYFDGKPLGTLLGCLRTEEGPAGGADESMLRVITLGAKQEFTASAEGTLYLRLNDAWNSLHDNQGRVIATIQEHAAPSTPQ